MNAKSARRWPSGSVVATRIKADAAGSDVSEHVPPAEGDENECQVRRRDSVVATRMKVDAAGR